MLIQSAVRAFVESSRFDSKANAATPPCVPPAGAGLVRVSAPPCSHPRAMEGSHRRWHWYWYWCCCGLLTKHQQQQ